MKTASALIGAFWARVTQAKSRHLRPHRSKRATSGLIAMSLLIAMLIVVEGPGAGEAEAATANPWVDITITKVADGTGHGDGSPTATQTFINSTNNFIPADDTPTDGVVASSDLVIYYVNLAFKASEAREVVVDLSVLSPYAASYLEWKTASDMFCRNGHFVTAVRSGNTCTFTVPAGAVEQIGAQLIFTAKDTQGLARDGQEVILRWGVKGYSFWGTTQGTPDIAVTVVSAPRVDVVVSAQTTSATSGSEFKSTPWTDGPASGYFVATPTALTYPGWAKKGVTTALPWWGTFDVTSFYTPITQQVYDDDTGEWLREETIPGPSGYIDSGQCVSFPGATWKVAGATQTPMLVDGRCLLRIGLNTSLNPTVAKAVGAVRIDYTVPGWPEQRVGDSRDYPVRVNVFSGSFSADRGPGNVPVVNNSSTNAITGDAAPNGWQPGDGLPNSNQTTANATIGSKRGQPYQNNDFSAARVVRSYDPPGVIWDKTIVAPTDTGRTVFEAPNMYYSANSNEANQVCTSTGNCRGIAPNGQATSVLTIIASRIPALLGSSLVLYDTWDITEQAFDPARGPVVVTLPDGTQLDPRFYTVSWSASEADRQEVLTKLNPNPVGAWVDQAFMPIDATARAVRIEFDPMLGVGPGAPTLTVRVPTTMANSAALADKGGELLNNTARLARWGGELVLEGAVKVTRGIMVRLPSVPNAVINHRVSVDPLGADPKLAKDTIAKPGQPGYFQVDNSVVGLSDTSMKFLPATVTVELDRCMTDPVNRDPANWIMTVTAAVPGPTGHVCGDPESTGIILTFTPVNSAGAPVSFKDAAARAAGNATLPPVKYEARSVLSAPSTDGDDPLYVPLAAIARLDVVLPAGYTLPEDHPGTLTSVDDYAQLVIDAGDNNASSLRANFPLIEVGDPLVWTWELYSTWAKWEGAQPNSSILVLPFIGDQPEMWDTNTDTFDTEKGNYEAFTTGSGSRGSAFAGSLELAGLEFVADDTTSQASLWYTDFAVTSLVPDDSTGMNWYCWRNCPDTYDPTGDPGLETAKAIRIDLEPQTGDPSFAKVTITLKPTDNVRGNEYVMWAGETDLGDWWMPGTQPDDTTRYVPAPWPASIQVVSSTITGTVWWDVDANTAMGTPVAEPRIAGVTITLHAANGDGTPGALIATTVTDANGFYQFAELHSGRYVTVVHKSDDAGCTPPIANSSVPNSACPLPASVVTVNGQTLPIANTYSFNNRTGAAAHDISTVINLGVNTTQPNVDFGYHKPSATIHGIVWWDTDGDGMLESLEPRIKDVWVRLYPASVNVTAPGFDKCADEPGLIAKQQTSATGEYLFTELAAGQYQTVVCRGTNAAGPIGNSHTTYYGQTLPITNTFSWDNQFGSVARDNSTTITLPNNGAQRNVNYGYFKQQPGVALDKSPAETVCGDNGYCQVTWDITVTNTGDQRLNNLEVWDRIVGDEAPVNIEAIGMQPNRLVQISVSKMGGEAGDEPNTYYSHALGLDVFGRIWAWGTNIAGKLGTNSPAGWDARVYVPTLLNGTGTTLPKFAAVSAGTHFSLALDEYGRVWSWGQNYYYQLGTGTNTERGIAGLVMAGSEPLKGIVAIAAGGEHSLALASDGTVWAWGSNQYGQVGNGVFANVVVPTQVLDNNGNPLTGISSISAGRWFSLALGDGSVHVWGTNHSRELALGVDAAANSAMGYSYPYNYPCSAVNSFQAGVEFPVCSTNAIPITALPHDVVSIEAGANHALALTSGGELWAWGRNLTAELGRGTQTNTMGGGFGRDPEKVVHPRGKSFITMAAGHRQSIAIDESFDTWQWGRFGPQNEYTVVTRPTQVATTARFESVVASGHASLALDFSGRLWAWGDNAYASLGTVAANVPLPTAVVRQPAGRFLDITQVAAGGNLSYGISSTGEVWSWGTGALGLGQTTTAQWYPSQVFTSPGIPLDGVTTIASYSHSVAATPTQLWTWGSNTYGQLGDGTTIARATPVAIPLTGVVKTAVGESHSIALDDAGRVWAWGQNNLGQLGFAGPNQSTPRPVLFAKTLRILGTNTTVANAPATKPTAATATTFQSSMTLPATGPVVRLDVDVNSAYCDRIRFSLIDPAGTRHDVLTSAYPRFCGQSTSTANPGSVSILYDTGVSHAAGTWTLRIYYTSTFTQTSTRNSWTLSEAQPVKIVDISSARTMNLAVDEDGTVWGWGDSGASYFGDGNIYSNQSRPYPVRVLLSGTEKSSPVPLSGATAVSVGNYFALVQTGTNVYAWGSNSYGQLGDGTTTSRIQPVRVLASGTEVLDPVPLNGVSTIKTGGSMSIALIGDELWFWGQGGMGDGTTTPNRLNPVRILASGLAGSSPVPLTGVTQVAAGSGHWVAMVDGMVYGAGWNTYGAVGTGFLDSSLWPAQVVSPDQTNWGTLAMWDHLPAGRLTPFASFDPLAGWAPLASNPGWDCVDANNDPASCRAYKTSLDPGESTVIKLTATYEEPYVPAQEPPLTDVPSIVVNQAWVNGAQVPYSGLHGQPAPNPPVVPDPSEFDKNGVPGNTTCDTNATLFSAAAAPWGPDLQGQPGWVKPPPLGTHWGGLLGVGEDSCDQVPARIFPTEEERGSLEGIAWVETSPGDNVRLDDPDALTCTNKGLADGGPGEARLPGVLVTLFNSTGTQVRPAVRTDECGWYEFTNLPAGRYTVQFAVDDETDAPPDGARWSLVTQQVGDDWRLDSDPDRATGIASTMRNTEPCALGDPLCAAGSPVPITVKSGERTYHIDAGYWAAVTDIAVLKYTGTLDTHSFHDGPESDPFVTRIPVGDLLSPDVPITVAIRNTGVEDLTDIEWVDEDYILSGTPEVRVFQGSATVKDWVCVAEFDDDGSLGTLPLVLDAANRNRLLISDGGDSFVLPAFDGDAEFPDQVVCTGTLPGLAATDVHRDDFRVFGIGVESGNRVTDNDDFNAVADPVTTISLRLRKVDGETAPLIALGGAEFTLETADGTPVDLTAGDCTDTAKGCETFEWTFSLELGVTYYLVEAKAPVGYSLLPDRIPIRVTPTGSVVFLTTDTLTPFVTLTPGATTADEYLITVANFHGPDLPATGGLADHQAMWALLIGALFVAIMFRDVRRRTSRSARSISTGGAVT